MKIEGIDLYRVSMPLLEPWKTAYGSQSDIESVFVHLRAEDTDGWGECAPAPLPLYNSEWTAGVFALARDVLAPRIVGLEISSGQELQEKLGEFKGNEFAKSAFDGAWWDARARQLGQPLWSLIGGNDPVVRVGADIPVLADSQALLARIGQAVDRGFPRVKLKFNRNCGYDMIAAARAAFPDTVMHIDCNSGFTLDDIDLFRKLDGLDLAMIEQPLGYDDLIDHATLQREIATPICLDESITSAARARKAIETGACRWINIKTSRVGGLTNAIAIHDLCAAQNIPVWVGGMLESTVGQGVSLALSTLGNIHYPCDIFPSTRFFKEDFSEPSITLTGEARIEAPSAAGHGFRPKLEMLKDHCLEAVSI
ncbi:o-succinylbenzoate synthase (plasmid) [Leisingera sp. M527]|uniref:o-succinylbenzoate synthase n=1 Tax=Leisingera sp. M527 TaxID=2867014 RepID=UPI0021A32627|nr:o-succinylbenzoate synthase [Leisingera sp. M527]UWQ35386.1 o-succinylbenzoate synthase [Leisingera sp. M527]